MIPPPYTLTRKSACPLRISSCCVTVDVVTPWGGTALTTVLGMSKYGVKTRENRLGDANAIRDGYNYDKALHVEGAFPVVMLYTRGVAILAELVGIGRSGLQLGKDRVAYKLGPALDDQCPDGKTTWTLIRAQTFKDVFTANEIVYLAVIDPTDLGLPNNPPPADVLRVARGLMGSGSKVLSVL